MKGGRQKAERPGLTLLEVLISMGVLMIGLVGVAALLPVGRFAIVETGKADRSSACGRAGLAAVRVRGMLDPQCWSPTPAAANDSFAIDPLGWEWGLEMPLAGAGGPIERITVKSSPLAPGPLTFAEAERIFRWRDDLVFVKPEDMEPPPLTDSTRPEPVLDASGMPTFQGDYTWLMTVTPAASEATVPLADRTLYTVSVAVCYKRGFAISPVSGLPEGEYAADVQFLGSGYGGGSVLLSPSATLVRDLDDPPLRLREHEWVLLCGQQGGRTICHWYRVVSADSGSPTQCVSLVGPDWDTEQCENPTLVAIDHVVGVYTQTIELGRSL